MGGSAPEAETPESEKLASRIGAQRWNQRYDDGYAQLEQEAIVDAGRNRHGLYVGRANADLAALEAKTVIQ